MSLPHVIAGNEPPIDNTPIFGAVLDTMASAFAAEGSQYAALKSFYTSTAANVPPPVSGVLSVNGADGVVVMDGANGVAVSSGVTPTVSLGDITPASINTTGTITAGGALTGSSASFTGPMTTGPISCSAVNVVSGLVTTSAGISAASMVVTGEGSVPSATISGAVTAGTFAVPGTLTAATLTAGSLGATAPGAISYTTPSNYQMTIAGWKVQWGVSSPSAPINNTDGSIFVNLNSERAYDGLYTIVATPVVLAGQAPFLCTVYQTPLSYGFYLICRKPDNTPVNGAVVTWMTIGNPP